MKKLMRPEVLIPVAAIAIVLLWFFTPLLVVRWSEFLAINASQYGAFGDLFGALTSLFTGLAMVGVFLVVYLDGRARRAETPPVLAPEVRAISYTPEENAEAHRFSIKIDFEIRNVGATPAFNWRWVEQNISTDSTKMFKAQDPSTKKHTPPIPGLSQAERGSVVLELVGDSARIVTDALKRAGELYVHLGLEYDGLGAEKWETKYSLRIWTDGGQPESLSGAVRLSSEILAGSWYTGKLR